MSGPTEVSPSEPFLVLIPGPYTDLLYLLQVFILCIYTSRALLNVAVVDERLSFSLDHNVHETERVLIRVLIRVSTGGKGEAC